MPDQPAPAVHSTFVLERTYPRRPERVFALLSSADAKRKWYLTEERAQIDAFDLDFRVGGIERARYTYHSGSPVDGMPFVNDGLHLDIIPNRRVVIASSMSINGQRISASLATFELAPTSSGTTLTFIHQGVFFEGADGPAMREQGWKTLLDRLASAVSNDASQ